MVADGAQEGMRGPPGVLGQLKATALVLAGVLQVGDRRASVVDHRVADHRHRVQLGLGLPRVSASQKSRYSLGAAGSRPLASRFIHIAFLTLGGVVICWRFAF